MVKKLSLGAYYLEDEKGVGRLTLGAYYLEDLFKDKDKVMLFV